MDSAEFLDLLGNDNRRRILRLLARKPCYVTEISEHLGVSPKAVIDHLRKLEDAGLVESRTDERRRKYFSIARHVHLEVTVSPYEFGTRSAYPSNSRFDITSCRQLSVELERIDARLEALDGGGEAPSADDDGSGGSERDADTVGPAVEDRTAERSGGDERSPDAVALARRLHDLEQLEREVSMVHRWTEGRINKLRNHLTECIDESNPRLVSELLVALAEQPWRTERLCRRLGVPQPVVAEMLDRLATRGLVRREGERWQLVE